MKSPRFTFALIGFAAAALLTGCLTFGIPGAKEGLSGATYIGRLWQAGKLPGVKTNDYPHITSLPISLTNHPQTLTFWITLPEKTNVVFWYEISRSDHQAPWTLASAVQADTNGQNSVDLLKLPVPDSREMELEAKATSK
jgi:hypothetical protein